MKKLLFFLWAIFFLQITVFSQNNSSFHKPRKNHFGFELDYLSFKGIY